MSPNVMTAARYHSHVQYYGPAIRQYYPLIFDAPGGQPSGQWAAYDPRHSYVDGYAVDYYGSSYATGRRLEGITAIAGSLPVGIREIGNAVPLAPEERRTESQAETHHNHDDPKGPSQWTARITLGGPAETDQR